MKLSTWMTENNLSGAKMAETLGTSAETVRRYIKNERIPNRDVMTKITEATGGQVGPEDFYNSEAA